MKHKKRIYALLFAIVLLLSATGCGKKDNAADAAATDTAATATAETTDAASTDTASSTENTDTPANVTSVYSPDDAIALVLEKSPPGATAYVSTAFAIETNNEYHSYFVIVVRDSYGIDICKVAVDGVTGEIFHYVSGKTFADFSQSPLFDAKRDTPLVWEGTFSGDESTLTTVKNEDGSLTYTFSDGTTGTGIITGNVVSVLTEGDAPQAIVMLCNIDGTMTVGGTNLALNGTYTPQTTAAAS